MLLSRLKGGVSARENIMNYKANLKYHFNNLGNTCAVYNYRGVDYTISYNSEQSVEEQHRYAQHFIDDDLDEE